MEIASSSHCLNWKPGVVNAATGQVCPYLLINSAWCVHVQFMELERPNVVKTFCSKYYCCMVLCTYHNRFLMSALIPSDFKLQIGYIDLLCTQASKFKGTATYSRHGV